MGLFLKGVKNETDLLGERQRSVKTALDNVDVLGETFVVNWRIVESWHGHARSSLAAFLCSKTGPQHSVSKPFNCQTSILNYFQSRFDSIFLHQYSLMKMKSEKNNDAPGKNRVCNGFLQLEKRLNDLGNDGATEILSAKGNKWVFRSNFLTNL